MLQGINITLYYIRTLQNATRYYYSSLLYYIATKRDIVLIIALYIILLLSIALLSIALKRYKTLQGINIALYYIRTLQNATRY